MSVLNVFRQQLGTVKVVMMSSIASQLYRRLFPKEAVRLFTKLEPCCRDRGGDVVSPLLEQKGDEREFISSMQLCLSMILKTKRKVQCGDYLSDNMHMCLGVACSCVCVVRIVRISICVSGVSLLCSFYWGYSCRSYWGKSFYSQITL